MKPKTKFTHPLRKSSSKNSKELDDISKSAVMMKKHKSYNHYLNRNKLNKSNDPNYNFSQEDTGLIVVELEGAEQNNKNNKLIKRKSKEKNLNKTNSNLLSSLGITKTRSMGQFITHKANISNVSGSSNKSNLSKKKTNEKKEIEPNGQTYENVRILTDEECIAELESESNCNLFIYLFYLIFR